MQAIAQFPRRSDQIPRARTFVRATLQAWGIDRPSDDVALMASELFTNAVLHGAGAVEVRVELLPSRIRIEVWDEGHSVELVARPPERVPPARLSGRGLGIVGRLAADWGSDGFARRTRVWAEVLRD
jgi:anti-sigma regulatory factor (Ser/Thr protein kinase)